MCSSVCFCALYKKYSLHSIYNHICQNHENLTVYSLTASIKIWPSLSRKLSSVVAYHINLPWPLPLLFNHPLKHHKLDGINPIPNAFFFLLCLRGCRGFSSASPQTPPSMSWTLISVNLKCIFFNKFIRPHWSYL